MPAGPRARRVPFRRPRRLDRERECRAAGPFAYVARRRRALICARRIGSPTAVTTSTPIMTSKPASEGRIVPSATTRAVASAAG